MRAIFPSEHVVRQKLVCFRQQLPNRKNWMALYLINVGRRTREVFAFVRLLEEKWHVDAFFIDGVHGKFFECIVGVNDILFAFAPTCVLGLLDKNDTLILPFEQFEN